MRVNTEQVGGSAKALADRLLRDVERIAERSAGRMQELVPAYAKVPADALVPVVLASTRDLLKAIRDPGFDHHQPTDHRALGVAQVRQGITTDDMLHGWRVVLEVVREEAYRAADELKLESNGLLEFVEASVRWGDAEMRASASAHHAAELETARERFSRLGREQAALRSIATLVAGGAPSDRLFALVAEQVAEVLGVPLVRITRYESDGTATDCASFSADREQPFSPGRRWSLEGTSVLSRVRTGQPARIDDYTGLPGPVAEHARSLGIQCSVGVPITVAGRIWGAMIALSLRGRYLPPDTEARLSDFTDLLGMAIANAKARAEVERLANEQTALREVATMIAREAPTEQVLGRVAREVGRLLGADGVVIHRFASDGCTTVVGAWGNAFDVGTRWRLDGDDVAAVVYRTQRPVRRGDPVHGFGPIAAELRTPGPRAAVASPIVLNGRLWGAIAAATSRAEAGPLSAGAQISEFSELVATAISNLQARSEITRLADEQAALRRVATMVARESPAADVFARVAEEIGLLLNAQVAMITRFEPDGDARLVGRWGTESQPGARWADLHHPVGRSHVSSPIVVDGSPWGAIVAAWSSEESLPTDAESRIAQFTDLVATSIANLQARADLAASRARMVVAADGERRRVVRDLHDGAQQRLVHTVITLNLASRALAQRRPDTAALVGEALRHAQSATQELRELAHGILPSALTNGGIRGGVRALASRMPFPTEVDVAVERFAPTVEATAYFVVAEALTNVAKHARAEHAAVRAQVEEGMLQIEISDDGVGGAGGDGSGLTGLRDRLGVVQGTLRVDSRPGGGTLITALIPLPPGPTAGR